MAISTVSVFGEDFITDLNANFAALDTAVDALEVAGSVFIKTADYTVLAADNYGTFANLGAAGAVTLTLPTPVAGLLYTFVVAEAQSLILDVGGSVVIAIGEIVGTAGGSASCASPYSSVTLKAISETLWVATSFTGSWTPS